MRKLEPSFGETRSAVLMRANRLAIANEADAIEPEHLIYALLDRIEPRLANQVDRENLIVETVFDHKVLGALPHTPKTRAALRGRSLEEMFDILTQ